VALCLDGLAGLELARNPARSVSLMAATAAWREREHNPLPPRYQPRRDRILEEARAQLGPATFAAAWSIGSTTPLDDLAAEVSTLLPSLRWQEAIADEQVRGTEPVMAIASTSRNAVDRLVEALNSTRMLSPTGNALGLTYRELEVLQLLTRRATDREIANALSISPRTAMHHVSNILTKLGVTNRRDAAEVAVRLDIG